MKQQDRKIDSVNTPKQKLTYNYQNTQNIQLMMKLYNPKIIAQTCIIWYKYCVLLLNCHVYNNKKYLDHYIQNKI